MDARNLQRIQRIANSLPVVGDRTQLCGETSWGQTYFAYGRQANGLFLGMWAATKGDWKLIGYSNIELKESVSEDAVMPALINHAENSWSALSKEHMTELGWWGHNRGH